MTLIIMLILIADSLCFRQVYARADDVYLKTSFIFLLSDVGAGLLLMGGFFIKRLVAGQS